jgi:hypothetical protein
VERISKTNDGMSYFVDSSMIIDKPCGFSGRAVEKLAVYENLQLALIKNQSEISQKLVILKNKGLKNSVRYKELMGKKLMNSYALSLFISRGL